jgi:UDP-2,3-diacylglucosamine hydrolase
LPDEAKINVYNTAVLLMHGDTLCTRDIVYLKARRKGRNPLLQWLFLLLPLKIRKHIANKMRIKSKRHTQTNALEVMDVTQDEVERVMQKHHISLLIHGHTHRPNIHHFRINHRFASRIVLGAWHDRCSNI